MWSITSSQNYAGSTEVVSQNCIYPSSEKTALPSVLLSENIRSAPFPLPLQYKPAYAELCIGSVSFPQCCFLSATFSDRALCCLAFHHFPLFSFQGANCQRKLRSPPSALQRTSGPLRFLFLPNSNPLPLGFEFERIGGE